MFRIDNTFPHCEKVLLLKQKYPRIFHQCITLWVFAGCHSDLNGTDGMLSRGLESNMNIPLKTASKCVEALLNVGLWELDGNGYRYHDWEHWNELKSQKQRRKDQARERKKKQRKGESHANVTRDSRGRTNTNTSTNLKREIKSQDCKHSPSDTAVPNPPPIFIQDKLWLQVIKAVTATTGQLLDAHRHQNAAEAILRLATQVNAQEPIKIVQRAVEAWWADEWVSSHRPTPAHLAKNFDKYINTGAPTPTDMREEFKDISREYHTAKQNLKLEQSVGSERELANAQKKFDKIKEIYKAHKALLQPQRRIL